jgi:uncharacterized protein YdeI (YjbR/CyaY-like superfamily)
LLVIETERFAKVEVHSAMDLRSWLAEHHAQSASVWLVTFKKHAGPAYVSKTEVLDELLCFGWVDGLARKLDADRTMQLISPRQMHAWAKSYRDRAARLERDGRMQQPGRLAIEHAKAMGLWLATSEVDALVIPPDLLAALSARPPANLHFMAFAPSHRRNVLRWIASAKRPATRTARVERTVALAALGQRVPQL